MREPNNNGSAFRSPGSSPGRVEPPDGVLWGVSVESARGFMPPFPGATAFARRIVSSRYILFFYVFYAMQGGLWDIGRGISIPFRAHHWMACSSGVGRPTVNRVVAGSNPATPAIFCFIRGGLCGASRWNANPPETAPNNRGAGWNRARVQSTPRMVQSAIKAHGCLAVKTSPPNRCRCTARVVRARDPVTGQ